MTATALALALAFCAFLGVGIGLVVGLLIAAWAETWDDGGGFPELREARGTGLVRIVRGPYDWQREDQLA